MLLDVVSDEQSTPNCLFQLSYEQNGGSGSVMINGGIVSLPSMPLDLAFNDAVMDQVKVAWEAVTRDDESPEEIEYMKFVDRNTGDDDYDD